VKDFFIKQKDHQFQKELIDILLLHWDDFISEYK